jgi:SAM-dependent methyltransferase
MNNAVVFDREQVRRQRDRAAARFANHDFLFEEVGERLLDRLSDITRRFPNALDLGCHTGGLGRRLSGRGGVERLVQCDLSAAMVHRAGAGALVADEEALPFAAQCFDLVLCNLGLHWVNDLPGSLVQIARCLVPDGLLLATLWGGGTLAELRACLQDAELEMDGGVSPRISPFVDLRDAGALLQRGGFALPVVDVEAITVTYRSPLALLADLRGMGETNAVVARRRVPLRRTTLMRAMALYQERHADRDGRIPATFEIVTLTAWRPHASQQQPLKPGSGQMPLGKALE